MPIRGENVGTAYVKILADGSGLKDSIRDDLDDTDKILGDKGRDNAKNYDEEFAKELKRGRPKSQKEIDKTFNFHSRKAKQLAQEMSSDYFKNLEKNIVKQNGADIGGIIVRDVRKDFLKSGGWGEILRDESGNKTSSEFLDNLLRTLPARVEAATKKVQDDYRQLDKDRDAADRENVRRFNASVASILAGYERIKKGSRDSDSSIGRDREHLVKGLQEIRKELLRTPSLGGDDGKGLVRSFNEIDNGLRRVHPRLRQLSGDLHESSDRMSKLFGKESRNDFLHFQGSVIGGITNMAAGVPRLVEHLLNIPTTFRAITGRIKEAEGVIGKLKAAFTGAGEGGGAFAKTLTSLGAALPIVVTAVGIAVAGVSLLAGTLVALASTISFALVGALGVTLGLLGPIAAAAGVVALAFLGLGKSTSEARKQLSAFIRPITSQLKALAFVTKQHLFANLAKDGKNFGDGLKNLKPLIVDTADNLSKMFSDVSKAAAGPGFKNYIKSITPILDEMLPKLGIAVGNITKGIAGIFKGVLPSANDFLTTLDKLTEKFDKWANSAKGQNSIKKFMDDAKESARSLGDFLGQLGGLIGDLLFNKAGKDVGDNLFEGMANSIKKFRAYIADGGLQKWFQDSEKFAFALGKMLVNVAKALDALDSPGFRAFAIYTIKAFAQMAKIVASVIEPIGLLIQAIDDLVHLRFGDAFSHLGESLKAQFKAVLNVASFGFADKVIKVFDAMGNAIKSGFGNAMGFIVDKLASVLDAVGKVGNVLGKIPGVPDTLGKSARDTARDMHDLADKMRTIGDTPIHTDSTPIKELGKNTRDSYADLLKMLGIPVIKPKVDPKSIEQGQIAAQLMSNSILKFFGIPTYKPKVDPSSPKTAREKFRDLLKAMNDVLHFQTSTPKINKKQIDAAKRSADAAITALKKLFSFKSHEVTITTNYVTRKKSVVATGGLIDEFGNVGRVRKMASGGFANFAQMFRGAQIGESGREAIVPLDRPLGQVDPSVRALAAFAQSGGVGGINNSKSKTIDASGWQIISNSDNSGAVAQQVLDRLLAAAY